MDIGNTSLLAFVLVATVEILKLLWPEINRNKQLLAATIVAVGLGAPQLVAHSDWGAKSIVRGLPLDAMNTGSLLLVSLGVIGFGMLTYKLIDKALPNIGENQPDPQ